MVECTVFNGHISEAGFNMAAMDSNVSIYSILSPFPVNTDKGQLWNVYTKHCLEYKSVNLYVVLSMQLE